MTILERESARLILRGVTASEAGCQGTLRCLTGTRKPIPSRTIPTASSRSPQARASRAPAAALPWPLGAHSTWSRSASVTFSMCLPPRPINFNRRPSRAGCSPTFKPLGNTGGRGRAAHQRGGEQALGDMNAELPVRLELLLAEELIECRLMRKIRADGAIAPDQFRFIPRDRQLQI